MQTARVFTRKTRPPGCLVVLSALHVSEKFGTVRRELIQMRAESVEGLRQRLQQGVDAGEISPAADVRALAKYYVTVRQGIVGPGPRRRQPQGAGADRACGSCVVERALAGAPRPIA